MRDPVELLLLLTDSLAIGKAPDPEAAEWFVAGVRRAVARAERLDHTLGLSRSGKRALQTSEAMMTRNVHLVRAAQGVVLDPRASAWDRALRLSEEIEAFVEKTWPAARRLTEPPRDWAPWQVHLFRAACTDLDMPRSPRHLYRLLTSHPLFVSVDDR